MKRSCSLFGITKVEDDVTRLEKDRAVPTDDAREEAGKKQKIWIHLHLHRISHHQPLSFFVTMTRFLRVGIAILAAIGCVSGFAPVPVQRKVALGSSKAQVSLKNEIHMPPSLTCPQPGLADEDWTLKTLVGATPAVATLLSALPANAADGAMFPVASAVVAYLHYAALLVCTAVLMTERLTVKPEMTFDEEERLWKADALYGISGLVLGVSGYYRAVEYGKGWEFYSHEPLFWFKLALVGIWGASSFFPTITILKRVVEQRETGVYPPMSEKLANRMTTVINAELLALAAIPLSATLMSRGVFYTGDFPWQLGAALVVVSFGGFGFKYVKEALTWTDDDVVVVVEEE